MKPILLCIDPGHGGTDPGAPGAVDSLPTEAQLNLLVAKKVKELIDMNFPGRIEARLTREDDTFSSVMQKAMIANTMNADWFVSIHFNSFTSTATGIETLYHPRSQKAFEFATEMQETLVAEFPEHKNRGIKPRENLAVLSQTMMPAILIECEFISTTDMHIWCDRNAKDGTISRAIVKGIANFLIEKTPIQPDTEVIVPTFPDPGTRLGWISEAADLRCPHCDHPLKGRITLQDT